MYSQGFVFKKFSSTIITVTPDIPQFFWAWAYAMLTLDQSIGLVRILEEQSSKRGTPGWWGNLWSGYSRPYTV